jgi:aquaglyceroporin related protein
MSEGTVTTAVTASSAYAEAGAPINRSVTAELKKESNAGLTWNKIRRTLREPFSEFMGV